MRPTPASRWPNCLAEPSNRLCDPIDRLLDRVDNDWAPLLRAWRNSSAGRQLIRFVDGRVAAGAVVFPADVFRALRCTPLAGVRVLVLGQDPYHGPGQADGLAFSVAAAVRHPPSLRNIFRELQRDLGIATPCSGHLQAWAEQGVLLLNTSLTVERGLPASHAKSGWEALTDKIIIAVSKQRDSKVFMLWGLHAQRKAALIEQAGAEHLVLQCNHPSPLSASRGPTPFIGSGVFGAAQAFLNARDRCTPGFGWARMVRGNAATVI